MWIYKITNIQNNKVYIGQTIRPIKDRFHRHINDAMNNILDTHFARAIRKYGKENFVIEEIDSATNQNELNKKEQYWIHYYNSVDEGYNETDAISKCGGNTYFSKTEDEMKIIKNKIR
jgi:group I intron endonuclease